MDTGSGSRYSIRFLLRLATVAAGLSTCSASAAPVEIAAHRGGYHLFPENTCASFRACEGLADRIEFDVRVAADGELVVIHDATVNRTAAGCGAVSNVADLTLAELKELDVGAPFSPLFAGERIPTLAEALRALPPGLPAMIHRKTGSAQALFDVLQAENAFSNLCVASGDMDFLLAFRKLAGPRELAFEGSGAISDSGMAWLQRIGVSSLLWDKDFLSAEIVQRVHAAGMRLSVAAIRTEFRKFVDLGVDRILADDPKLAKLMADDAPSANARLARDLAAYWPFDDAALEPAPTNAADVEERAPLALSGFDSSSAWLSGADARFGGALALDGIDDFLCGPPLPFLAADTNQLSLSLWVKLACRPSELPADWAVVYDTASNACSVYLDRVARELRFKVVDASLQAARPGIPETRLAVGVWHHVVGVFDAAAGPVAGRTMIYLDGQLQDIHDGADSSVGFGLTNAVRRGHAPVLGRFGSAAARFFAGAVDDVAVWNRALSPAEVRQIHSAGTNGLPLEKSVMTLWIENVYPDLATGEMVMDVRVDHGSLTNQSLVLHSAVAAAAPYSDQAVLESRRGRRANFHVPRSGFVSTNAPRACDAPRPNFFRIACP